MKKKEESPGWTLDELVELANSRIAQNPGSEEASDERLRSEITPRNLRRLAAEGAIDPPSRYGREARYEPRHLDQLLRARALMSQGFSCSAVRKLRESGSETSYGSLADPAYAAPALMGSAAPLEASSLSAAPELSQAQRARAFLDGLSASPQGSSAAFSGRALGSGPAVKPLGSEAAFGVAKAWAGSEPKSASPAASALWAESEALPGLRVCVSSAAAARPLTDEIRASALASLEAAWAQARARLGG